MADVLSLLFRSYSPETFISEFLHSTQSEFLIMRFSITFYLLVVTNITFLTSLIWRCKRTSIQLSLLQQDTVDSALSEASGFSSLLTSLRWCGILFLTLLIKIVMYITNNCLDLFPYRHCQF